jgi:hypothetical protein
MWLRCVATLEISVPIEILSPSIRGRNLSARRLVLRLHPLSLATIDLRGTSLAVRSPQLFPSQRASTRSNLPPTTSTAYRGPSKSHPNSPTPRCKLPTRRSPTSASRATSSSSAGSPQESRNVERRCSTSRRPPPHSLTRHPPPRVTSRLSPCAPRPWSHR